MGEGVATKDDLRTLRHEMREEMQTFRKKMRNDMHQETQTFWDSLQAQRQFMLLGFSLIGTMIFVAALFGKLF